MVTLALLGLVASLPTANARDGRHGGFHGHQGMAGSLRGASRGAGSLASEQRHANDDYVKAAAEEEDKLLDSKIKSICRGC
jgi:hypothetical protein